MDPSHRDLAIRAAEGGGDAVLLEALLEDVDIGSSDTASPPAPQALSPRAAWPEQDHEDVSVVEPLVSACREMEALEDQELAALLPDYDQTARARLVAWQERRDASAQRWADAKHTLREEWQDEALLSAESSDAEDCQEPLSSSSVPATGLEAADGGDLEEDEAPQEEPASPGGLLDGTKNWEALRGRIGEVLRMASEKGQALDREEADLDVDEGVTTYVPQGHEGQSSGVLIPQDPPQSGCYSDSRPTAAKADTSQTIPREDRPMTVVDVVRPALPSQGTEAVAPLPEEVPQSAWASSQARRRELSCMVQEDALVTAQASATEHERGRLTLEDTFALRYRQWELYQQGRSPSFSTLETQQRELSYERRAMEGADQAARAWLQRQHTERLLMAIADDQSAAHRMEDRRDVEGRRMLRAMHESRAYRIHLKALRQNRDAMVVEDSGGRERRESLWMAQEERPSSWWRSADRSVTVIARAVRKRRAEVALPHGLQQAPCWTRYASWPHSESKPVGGAIGREAIAWQRCWGYCGYSSIGDRYLHDPAGELGEVDLTDILRAEEGISSLFPDRPTLVVPNRTEEAIGGPAGTKPNEESIRLHDTTHQEKEENIHPMMGCSRATSPLLPDINSHRSTTSSRQDTTASSSSRSSSRRRSSTAEEINARAATSEQVVPLPPILPRWRSAVVAWRTPTPSVHQDALQAEGDAPAHPSLTGLVARRPSRIAGPGKITRKRPPMTRPPPRGGSWASPRPKEKHPLNAQESVRLFLEQQRQQQRKLPDYSAGQ
ncbi:hypothetical protein FOL46_003228 [Perkinsus olseni]|uniref:Uncharacterized protein n=1 Tax=Perkinsus olseni TaxID=32597 RepID=A0A7J6M416_PEROL|nr:hypothetical protein FOL46_003228 [Perkinsus olseni]